MLAFPKRFRRREKCARFLAWDKWKCCVVPEKKGEKCVPAILKLIRQRVAFFIRLAGAFLRDVSIFLHPAKNVSRNAFRAPLNLIGWKGCASAYFCTLYGEVRAEIYPTAGSRESLWLMPIVPRWYRTCVRHLLFPGIRKSIKPATGGVRTGIYRIKRSRYASMGRLWNKKSRRLSLCPRGNIEFRKSTGTLRARASFFPFLLLIRLLRVLCLCRKCESECGGKIVAFLMLERETRVKMG